MMLTSNNSDYVNHSPKWGGGKIGRVNGVLVGYSAGDSSFLFLALDGVIASVGGWGYGRGWW